MRAAWSGCYREPGRVISCGMLADLRVEYRTWERRSAPSLKGDPIWRMTVYRLARFTADRAWVDVTRLGADPHTRWVAADLCRSVGAICSDLSEGYSRSSGRDRVRFYQYALGSARESRDWYLQGEPVLGETRVALAVELLNRICRLTLSLIPAERRRQIRPSRGKATPPNHPRQHPPSPAPTQHAVRSTHDAEPSIHPDVTLSPDPPVPTV